jgi:hypothetical protein
MGFVERMKDSVEWLQKLCSTRETQVRIPFKAIFVYCYEEVDGG